MRTPDRIGTVVIATVAAMMVTAAGFALTSGEARPDDSDLPVISTSVDPNAVTASVEATDIVNPTTAPGVPVAPSDDDSDDGDEDRRETVKNPVRVEKSDEEKKKDEDKDEHEDGVQEKKDEEKDEDTDAETHDVGGYHHEDE
jgi:hypothetical protein